MKYFPEFSIYDETLELVDYSPNYNIGEFQCKDDDYVKWLLKDAPKYIKQNLSRVVLLLNQSSREIIGYMAFCTDSLNSVMRKKRKLR